MYWCATLPGVGLLLHKDCGVQVEKCEDSCTGVIHRTCLAVIDVAVPVSEFRVSGASVRVFSLGQNDSGRQCVVLHLGLRMGLEA
jgi:hypothetical protein